ncbi:hypothetical protein CRUP_000846 [Coryphaenoides rupestris]|nr:hypothetical protein CRUP_000846 [Coryphaenoides rupestris]
MAMVSPTASGSSSSFIGFKPNGDVVGTAPNRPEEGGEVDQFDAVVLAPEKLSHPTADRAKPPGRRPPSGLVSPGPASETVAPAPKPDPLNEASLEGMQAEIRELRMALELLKTRQERDMKEVKEELVQERHKRMILQGYG